MRRESHPFFLSPKFFELFSVVFSVLLVSSDSSLSLGREGVNFAGKVLLSFGW